MAIISKSFFAVTAVFAGLASLGGVANGLAVSCEEDLCEDDVCANWREMYSPSPTQFPCESEDLNDCYTGGHGWVWNFDDDMPTVQVWVADDNSCTVSVGGEYCNSCENRDDMEWTYFPDCDCDDYSFTANIKYDCTNINTGTLTGTKSLDSYVSIAYPFFFPLEEDEFECVDDPTFNKKKKTCAQRLQKEGLKRKKIKKRCKQKWKGTKVFDWCPESCALVGLGPCVAE